jgi:hypothetical protein
MVVNRLFKNSNFYNFSISTFRGEIGKWVK